MEMYQWVSLILNFVLGGGLIVTLVTLRSQKIQAAANAQKAIAEARADELKNVETAIKIWREMAESLADKYDVVAVQVENLTKEVARLNSINSRIVKLLDKLTPENMDKIVEQIKKEICNEEKELKSKKQ